MDETIQTWRPTIIEGECEWSEENLDQLLAKIKKFLLEHSCSSASLRRISDMLILKCVD